LPLVVVVVVVGLLFLRYKFHLQLLALIAPTIAAPTAVAGSSAVPLHKAKRSGISYLKHFNISKVAKFDFISSTEHFLTIQNKFIL